MVRFLPAARLSAVEHVLRHNLTQLCQLGKNESSDLCLWHLMWDEIASEDRIRWSGKELNSFLGLAYEKIPDGMDLKFNTYQDALDLQAALIDRRVARGTEISVLCVAPIREQCYHPVPVLMVSTAKGASAALQASILRQVTDAWRSMPLPEFGGRTCRDILGPQANATSDGDGPRRQAFHKEYCAMPLPSRSQLYITLCPLLMVLFDIQVGIGPEHMTERFDDKHNLKRLRERQKSDTTGVQIGDRAMTRPVIRHLLQKAGLGEWIQYLEPDDPQSVPLAVKMQIGISKRGDVDANTLINLTPTDLLLMEDAQILGAISKCLLVMIAGTDFNESQVPVASISDILVASSKLSHLLIVVHRKHKTKFIPNQLYHDLQTLVKDNFFSVARQQCQDPSRPLYIFQLSNDLLEQLFGIVRCLTHNRNVDALEFAERVSIASRIMDIYSRHAEWDRGARRLCETLDRVNVRSWKGDTSVRGLVLHQLWARGATEAHALLTNHPHYDASDLDFTVWSSDGCTMLRPFGEIVGVNELSEEVYNDASGVAGSAVEAAADEEVGSEDLVDGQCVGSAADQICQVLLPGPGEKQAHKATCVKELFSAESIQDRCAQKSTDRIKRARGYARFQPASNNSNHARGSTNESSILLGDPYATLVKTAGGVSLAIMSLNRTDGCESTDSVLVNQLQMPDVKLCGRRMEIKHDGLWSMRLVGADITVPGAFVTALNPGLAGTTFQFDASQLAMLKESLWCSLKSQQNKFPSLLQHVPFNAELIVAETVPASAEEAEANRPIVMHECSLCHHKLLADTLRLHVAAHKLLGQSPGHAACGYCGQEAGCTTTMKPGGQSKSIVPASSCPAFYKFSVACVKKCKPTTKNPCSNMPIECPDCTAVPQHPCLYNIFEHYAVHHPHTDRGQALQEVHETLRLMITSIRASHPPVLPPITIQSANEMMFLVLKRVCFDGMDPFVQMVRKIITEAACVLNIFKREEAKRNRNSIN